jgi:ribosomal protein S18 acetylase RimI-like enzyme
MIKIVDATTGNIPVIKAIAEKTWWPTYSSILTDKQLTYMLDAIYSDSALLELFENGSQTFIILYDDAEAKGFASFGLKKDDPAICKLHKLYVLPNNHGKGYGKMLIDEVKNRITNTNIYTLDLNVNRFNPARSFYEKIGFKVIKEEDVPIGPYFMNDYVMRLEITK